MIDFLVYNDETQPLEHTLKFRYDDLNRGYNRVQFSTEYILPKDGTYSYYKLVIPIVEHFLNADGKYHNIEDEMFYYKGNIYLCNTNTGFTEFTLSELLSNSKVLENCLDWYNTVHDNHASQTFYLPAKKLFSVCRLNRCLVSLQKNLLGCNNPCKNMNCDVSAATNQRNFLLCTLQVFDYLKDIGNYSEAQRILDNLSSCNFICDEGLISNDCGCGSSK